MIKLDQVHIEMRMRIEGDRCGGGRFVFNPWFNHTWVCVLCFCSGQHQIQSPGVNNIYESTSGLLEQPKSKKLVHHFEAEK